MRHIWKMVSIFILILSMYFLLLSLYLSVDSKVLLITWDWGSFTEKVSLSFIFDKFSCLFFCVVMLISGSVFFYSMSYMEEVKYFHRFMILTFLFVFSMGLMIFSCNIVGIVLGWDGLGITSFLLVIFYANINSVNAGLITALTNRLGDVGLIFMMGMCILGSWSMVDILFVSDKFPWIISLLIFFTASTKSAQIPFSAWLPAAMAAPTPISSLVHSSTLVTAGVYLLFRFSGYLWEINSIMLFMGGITAAMASMAAVLESDMKKIIALSTLSHLGVMIAMLGLNFVIMSFSHLIFHAFFKALLFMSVGVSIHISNNYQDSKKISNLWITSKVNHSFATISIVSLCGIPFMTGFYSKDLFLEKILLSSNYLLILMFVFFFCLASFLYSVRFILSFGLETSKNSSLVAWGESMDMYFKSMIGLWLGSIFLGKIFMVTLFYAGDVYLMLSKTCKLIMSFTIILFILISIFFSSFSKMTYNLFINLMFNMSFLTSLSRSIPNHLMKITSMFYSNYDKTYLSPYSSGYLSMSSMNTKSFTTSLTDFLILGTISLFSLSMYMLYLVYSSNSCVLLKLFIYYFFCQPIHYFH